MRANIPFALPNKAGIADAPLAIVIAAKEGLEFDAGLATESMALEAILLGYGEKIIGSPMMVLNGENREEYKKMLGIGEEMEALNVLLVGYKDNDGYLAPDAVSSASTRKDIAEVTSIIR